MTLSISKDKAKAIVPKDPLCEISSFFRAAFMSQFKEATDQSIDLPEDDIETVEDFIQWLYSGKYSLGSSAEIKGTGYEQPLRLLIFADKYDVTDLLKYLYEALIKSFKRDSETPSQAAIRFVYESTYKGSGIRRLVAEKVVLCLPVSRWLQKETTYEWLLTVPEFSVDLLIASAEMQKNSIKNLFDIRTPDHYMKARVMISAAEE